MAEGDPAQLRCACGHSLDVHGPSPRTGQLCCFDLDDQGDSCRCDDYVYEGAS